MDECNGSEMFSTLTSVKLLQRFCFVFSHMWKTKTIAFIHSDMLESHRNRKKKLLHTCYFVHPYLQWHLFLKLIFCSNWELKIINFLNSAGFIRIKFSLPLCKLKDKRFLNELLYKWHSLNEVQKMHLSLMVTC